MKKFFIALLILGQPLFVNAQTKNVPCPGVPTVTYAG
jgi:hypothetical protein